MARDACGAKDVADPGMTFAACGLVLQRGALRVAALSRKRPYLTMSFKMSLPQQHQVIIVGGGLAGMATGVALESAGVRVTLLESRRTLGGRAGSFEDPQTGEQLDNCQHVLLGCCTNLIDFYRRIGSDKLIQFHR